MNHECCKCKKYGLKYQRKYRPADFLEGKRSSNIWIVGLNPKGNSDKIDEREVEDVEGYFNHVNEVHPYFRDFKKVSGKLYDLLGKEKGAAHTDIVKCFSNRFPPGNCKRKEAEEIIDNCKEYFKEQINEWLPDMIICNGSPVCRIIKEIIPVKVGDKTSYTGKFKGKEITVILSGFIGRIDDYAKARLGKEIESHMG